MSLRYKGAVISATPPTTTGGNSGTAPGAWTLQQQLQAQAAGNWPNQPVYYIEDVFSTYLYTGNSTSGGTQTITNSIDLSTKGGMVWIKGRSAASNNELFDTVRGAGTGSASGSNKALSSNLTAAQGLALTSDYLSAFSSTGFTVTQGGATTATRATNYNAVTYASWTFRKQPKFFDVVTYTGNGVAGRTVSHNLGSVPGCMIVKCTSAASTSWYVYHRSLGATKNLFLNTTAATQTETSIWNDTEPTSTVFTVGINDNVNQNGQTFVAYLFAHDAGGFGLTGTDNVISCGSFTSTGATPISINLGYEPQWILAKQTNATSGWYIFDVMRGMSYSADAYLSPNTSTAEGSTTGVVPTATGWDDSFWNSGNQVIYIAIRRGPMKTPTSGTSVFNAFAGSDTSAITTNFPVDFFIENARVLNSANSAVGTRLLGGDVALVTSSTAATQTGFFSTTWYQNNTSYLPACFGTAVAYAYQRAPGFFDVVCYTGTGSATTVAHNLGVAPEMMIVKRRDNGTPGQWFVYSAALGVTGQALLTLQTTNAAGNADSSVWNDTSPTATVFSVGGGQNVNGSGGTYVAYLFASCPGVSKVGSYTGTGTTKQIDCGFTGGARFVLIKRTDSTGDWYVWDSARGIVAGNDPYLLLNSTAAEVTNTDYVDTYAAGFEISSTAPAAINANGGTFIFLAVS